jgi:hypothetical protein
VNAVCIEAARILHTVKLWERFRSEKRQGDDSYVDDDGKETKIAWAHMLNVLNVPDVQLRLRINGLHQLDYGFRSLIAAMRIMLILNAVSGSVRICALPECNRAFIARNERSRLCSESHSNRNRQRKFEKRKKRKH